MPDVDALIALLKILDRLTVKELEQVKIRVDTLLQLKGGVQPSGNQKTVGTSTEV